MYNTFPCFFSLLCSSLYTKLHIGPLHFVLSAARLTMNTLDLPDSRHPSLDIGVRRNTRRNSMSEMLKRYGSQTNLQRTPSTNNIRRSTSRNSLVLEWTQEGKLVSCRFESYCGVSSLLTMVLFFP